MDRFPVRTPLSEREMRVRYPPGAPDNQGPCSYGAFFVEGVLMSGDTRSFRQRKGVVGVPEGAKWVLAVVMAAALTLMFHFATLFLMTLFDFDYFGAFLIVFFAFLSFCLLVTLCYMAISTRW